MTSINEIFRTFGPEYLERYANLMPKTHLKVIDAMMACRTENCGLALYQCESCSASHQLYRSCGNRHCPTCQQHKTRQWLQKQFERQLPTHPFLITFTVPEKIRPFIRKTSVPLTPPCLRPPLKRLKNSPPIHITSAPTCRVSSASFTLGDEPCSTIPISITSSPAALSPQSMAAGIPPELTSISPSKLSPKSFKPSSAIK